MLESPLISVIIPAYNAERVLERCLDSIVNQTYKDFEIVIVEDGSKDASLKICQEYKKRYSDKISVVSQANAGPSAARNTGIANSRGKYLSFVDADDYIELDMLEQMINCAQEQQAEMVICGFYRETGKKSLQVSYNHIPDGLYAGTQCRTLAKNMIDASNQNALPPYSPIRLVLKTCITEHSLGFDERLVRSEDYHFWVKVHQNINRLYMLGSKALYHYVQNSGSITHRYINNYWEGVLIIYHDFLNQLPNDIDTIHGIYVNLLARSIVALNNAVYHHNFRAAWCEMKSILYHPELVHVTQEKINIGSKKIRMYCWLIKHNLQPVLLAVMLYRRIKYICANVKNSSK